MAQQGQGLTLKQTVFASSGSGTSMTFNFSSNNDDLLILAFNNRGAPKGTPTNFNGGYLGSGGGTQGGTGVSINQHWKISTGDTSYTLTGVVAGAIGAIGVFSVPGGATSYWQTDTTSIKYVSGQYPTNPVILYDFYKNQGPNAKWNYPSLEYGNQITYGTPPTNNTYWITSVWPNWSNNVTTSPVDHASLIQVAATGSATNDGVGVSIYFDAINLDQRVDVQSAWLTG
jgi:hypothetical protein